MPFAANSARAGAVLPDIGLLGTGRGRQVVPAGLHAWPPRLAGPLGSTRGSQMEPLAVDRSAGVASRRCVLAMLECAAGGLRVPGVVHFLGWVAARKLNDEGRRLPSGP